MRAFLVLLVLTVGTSGVLMFIGYSFSRNSIEKRTIENVYQQTEIIRDKFDAEYRTNLNRSLRALVNDPILDDYLRASQDERLIIRRKIETKFRQVLRDFKAYHHIGFLDADGNVSISILRGSKTKGSIHSESGNMPALSHTKRLFKELESTPLLLSSGNMEWFMPPREVQVEGPFVGHDGSIQALFGMAKLDLDTGDFGGIVLIHQIFDNFFADLKEVKFFDENPLWIFSPDGEILQGPEKAFTPFALGEVLPKELQSDTLLLTPTQGVVAFTDFSIVPGKSFFRLMIEIPRSLLLKDLKPTIQFFTVALAISVVVMLFLSLYISRFLSRPFLELQTTEGRLANAQRIAKLGHWEYEPSTETITLSEQAQDILGVEPSCTAFKLSDFIDCVEHDNRNALQQKFDKSIQNSEGFSLETALETGRVVHLEIVVEDEPNDRDKRILGTIQDISERKETEQQIRHLAYYDAVTGLPNRSLLNEHGKQILESSSEPYRYTAILFLDLDHFKKVNDSAGHSAGDELLRQVSDRLRFCIRKSDSVSLQRNDLPGAQSSGFDDTIARLGGDEFIVLLSGLRRAEDAALVAQRINKAISKRFVVHGKEIYTSCSIGISVCPRDGETTEELLKHADAAMYQAKNSGRNQYKFYSAAIYEQVQARLSLETQLHQAVANNEFELVYQPRINISSGNTVAIEALIRWAHPDRGLITPDQFISVAEETGLIIPIGEQVLATACKQTKYWHESGFPHVNVSVNISAAQFNKGLVDAIENILVETGLDARYLELEVTESLLIENIEVGSELLYELKEMGLSMSIDDFGKGYSSLSMLKHLPVDTLKIDKSFTMDLLKDPGDALIVKSTIELGHNLGLRVIAEGVEHPGQLEFLRKHHCDEAQGYLISKPLWPQDFTQWFDKKAS